MIVGSLASFPARYDLLCDVLPVLAAQVDRLCLQVNGPVPDCASFGAKISTMYCDRKDNAKFWPLEWLQRGDFLAVFDDDLIYPSDIVRRLLEGMVRAGAPAVGFNGCRLKRLPLKSYYHQTQQGEFADDFPCSHEVIGDHDVDILSCCATLIDISRVPLCYEDFGARGMTDIWFSRRLAELGIRRVVLEHPKDYITQNPRMAGRWTLCTHYSHEVPDTLQTKLVNSTDWGPHVTRAR